MNTYVEFRSDRFPPYEEENERINPGVYGKRLAEFLVRNLPAKGFKPDQPIAEDWGWIVPIENAEFPLWIGCGHYEEYPDGFLCFIEPHKPFVRKWFRKIDASTKVNALQRALDEIFSAEPGIRSKPWWTHAEFTLQSREEPRERDS
jgi:hypothetical protein